MVHSGTVCLLRSTAPIALAVLAALTWLQPLRVQAQQSPLPENRDAADPLDPTDPNNIRPATSDTSLLSIAGGQRLMSEANTAVSSQNYALAAQKFQESRQVFNQLSNFYQQLATAFSGIDNRLSDTNRTKALETAQMRDDATYLLALVHRAQNKPELAVPLLIQIIRSQQPTRDLGKKAYQQLLELGFVDVPYPRPARDAQPSSSTK
ncbi:hypothetical protein BCD67_21630 [Oscillatoriales cyanobacterium USR001]|nr:hypothetical protein BCD67_21630 [Oscillatoriales cyanobacterium USR001]